MAPKPAIVQGLLAFSLAAVAAAGATAALRPRHGEIRAVVREAAEAAHRGDARTLWNLQSMPLQIGVDRYHRGAVEAWYRQSLTAAVQDTSVPKPAKSHPGAPGSSGAVIWTKEIERCLGGSARRNAYEEVRIESIEVEGPRAVVRSTLASGEGQEFRLLHQVNGWRLDGFEPYRAGTP